MVLFLNCKKSQWGLFSILAGVEGELPCLQAHSYTNYQKMQEQFSHVKNPSLKLLSLFSTLLSVDRTSKVLEGQLLQEACGGPQRSLLHMVLEGFPRGAVGQESATQEMLARSRDQEDLLEEGMATQSSILA